MYFDVKHNSLLAHTGGKLLRTDQIGLPRSPRLRREYVLDGKNFAGSTKKVYVMGDFVKKESRCLEK